MDIRAEQPSDREAIDALIAAAFGRRAEADLVDWLRADGDHVISLVAEEGNAIPVHRSKRGLQPEFGKIDAEQGASAPAHERSESADLIGHVLFSRMTAPFRALGLGPVAVLPERQRQGLGGALIRAGLQQARDAGWEGVFVLGDPAYYRRFGFAPDLAAGFASPYAGPYFMALALQGGLPATGGAVAYAPAFARLG